MPHTAMQVLPPGEFKNMIPQLLAIYSKSFVPMTVTVACLGSSVDFSTGVQCALAVWPWRSGVQIPPPRLVGTCGLISAYSEINISQAGTKGPPLSSYICDRPPDPGLRAPGRLVRASVGVTDEAGTTKSTRPQRTGVARKIIGTSPSTPLLLPCTHTTRTVV